MTLKVRPNAIEQDEGRFKFPQAELVSGAYVHEGAEPENIAGKGAFYASSDGKPYFKAGDGTEYDLSEGTGGGGGGSGSVIVLNDGSVLGSATRLDFIGDGVSPVLNGETAEITISGGGGGGGGDPVSVSTGTVYAEETIYEVELGSATGSVVIPQIPDNYDHLKLYLTGFRSDRAASVDEILLFFNGDETTSNYRAGGAVHGGIDSTVDVDDPRVLTAPAGNNDSADSVGVAEVLVADYGGSDRKTFQSIGNYRFDSTRKIATFYTAEWENTSAINQITLVSATASDIVAGSTVRLVGIKEKVVVTSVSGGGGEPADIYENGGLVLADAEEIDFVGDGVDVTVSGSRAQVNVSGGGGPAFYSVVGDGGGSHTTSSTTFSDLSGMSLTIDAEEGDELEIKFNCSHHNSQGDQANKFRIEVGGTEINPVAMDTVNSANLVQVVALIAPHTVEAGDISGGQVTIQVKFAIVVSGTCTVINHGGSGRVPTLTVINYGS